MRWMVDGGREVGELLACICRLVIWENRDTFR